MSLETKENRVLEMEAFSDGRNSWVLIFLEGNTVKAKSGGQEKDTNTPRRECPT
jgi:hypothetical protein